MSQFDEIEEEENDLRPDWLRHCASLIPKLRSAKGPSIDELIEAMLDNAPLIKRQRSEFLDAARDAALRSGEPVSLQLLDRLKGRSPFQPR